MAGNAMESGRTVTSKVVAILMTFVDGEVHTLTEVARLAGIPTSTVHRLIGELAAWGVLERSEGSHYRVGGPLREICFHSARSPNLLERATRVMEDINLAVQTPVRFGMLVDHRVRFIEKVATHRPATSYADAATAPAHATAMGKVLLAFSSPADFELVVSKGLKGYTPHTLTSVEELHKSMASIRLSKLGLSRSEWILGVSALAVPVFGAGGRVVAALELAARDLRADLRALHPVLTVAARGHSRDVIGASGIDLTGRAHRAWRPPLRLAPAEAQHRQTANL
jgi:DNA-binding IclR family transcriptional regulator